MKFARLHEDAAANENGHRDENDEWLFQQQRKILRDPVRFAPLQSGEHCRQSHE